ncbi:MAG: endonuclease III [Thermoprotei archaeon]|nr:endonuclease III [Thermoprotei archaeon]
MCLHGKDPVVALALILTFAEKNYGKYVEEVMESIKKRSLFEQLIATIISQNTNWKNTKRALHNLREYFAKISPEKIAKVDLETLERLLKPAGLYKVKSKVIKDLANEIIRRKLLEIKNAERLRNELLKIRGIGPKTVDVVLAFSLNEPILPVDTHIRRISLRIGLTSSRKYYDIRRSLERSIPSKYRVKAHLLLISFGRNVCRSREPLCWACPASKYCLSSRV